MNALMENEFIDAELTYIVDDGKPSIRYVDWPEEKHNERLASYEARQTRIFNGRLLANPPKLDDFGFELLKRRLRHRLRKKRKKKKKVHRKMKIKMKMRTRMKRQRKG